MYPDDVWTALPNRQLRPRTIKLLEQRNPGLSIGGRPTQCGWRPLPFYAQGDGIVRITDSRWPAPLAMYALYAGGELHWLNGQSPAIHEANAKTPIRLNADNVWDYLRFFCFFVRGEEGPFYIHDGREDPRWPAALPEELQQRLEAVCRRTDRRPAADEDGAFRFDALVHYGSHFFEARFQIEQSGMIAMADDSPIEVDTPCALCAPIVPKNGGDLSRGHPEARRRAASAPPRDAEPDTGRDPDAVPAVASPNDDEAAERRRRMMADAHRAFADSSEARHVRDFFFNWYSDRVNAKDGNGAEATLAKALAADILKLMDRLMASADTPRLSLGRIVLLGRLEMPAEGPLRQEMERYRRLQEPVRFRQAPDPETFVREMTARSPHMAEVIGTIADHLRLSWRFGDGRLRLPPLLLVGPPGCGKSWLARTLCDLLNVPQLAINAGGSNDNRFLCGTSRGWSTAEPSAPVRLLAGAGIANPALIVEEIDKAGGSERNGDPHGSLLTMIDPTTAKAWTDEYLATAIDISHVNWIMTANDAARLPAPLHNRLTTVRIAAPTGDQVAILLDKIVEEVVLAYGGTPGVADPLAAEDRAALLARVHRQQLGLRDLRRAVVQTLGNGRKTFVVVN